MKRLKLAILLLLIPLCCVAFAALVKTTTIVELDPWQAVAAATLDVGSAGDISGSYSTLLYLEIAYADNTAQDGVEVSIEVSYGDDDWTLLTPTFTTPADTPAIDTINDATSNPGDTTVILTGGADDFDLPGRKWFIKEATAANSESVRTKSGSGTITICQDLIRGHTNGASCYDYVFEQIIPIPTSFAYVRVLINNVDGAAPIYYTTRLSKVTGV